MPHAPVPTAEKLVQLYKVGELTAELSQFHERVDERDDIFVTLCVTLHNRGEIDLVRVPSEPTFKRLSGHAFFIAQQFYCEAIPKLVTSHTDLMECCRILIEAAGADGAANQPNGAFLLWCRNNATGSAAVIEEARAGDELAIHFVAFALQATLDLNSATDFVVLYNDRRRLAGMNALANMTFREPVLARKVIATIEPFVADRGDDNVRANALSSAFDVLKQHNDSEAAKRLVEAACQVPGAATLHALAKIVWLHQDSLNGDTLKSTLGALEAVNPEHLGTIRILDMGLQRLLGTDKDSLVIDFIATHLRNNKLTITNFDMTAHEIVTENELRLFDLIVRWFLSGNIPLCSNVVKLLESDRNRVFDAAVKPFEMTSEQQLFLCRKAVGFLFLKPVLCCSMLVAVLRVANKDVEGPIAELLFDPILLNYGGDAREYLAGVPKTDRAYGQIQKALAKVKSFYRGLAATGTIKELQPSERQRDVVRQRSYDEMRAAHKNAQSNSPLMSMVRRSTILYGKRSLNFVAADDGSHRGVAMDLKSFEASFELPRREILDPVGLDHMLRMFRLEKLK